MKEQDVTENAETDRTPSVGGGAASDEKWNTRSANGISNGSSPGVAEIETNIERSRANLAETVDQLAAKFDVETRFRHRVAGARDDVTRQLRTLRHKATAAQRSTDPQTIGIGAGVLAAAVAVLVVTWWRRNQAPRGWGRRR
jgi:hypothetical protein